ncbi:MAG: GAF domain-containing protein [Chloroflexi bacterium]|nr:GAF domain-containing protein [Chloroflexota bacterium]
MANQDPRLQLAAELAALRLRVRELESRGTSKRGPAERVLESSADGALSVDAEGRISFFNSVATELTGWPLDDALGRPVSEVLPVARQDASHPISSVLTGGATEHHERFDVVGRNGTSTSFTLNAAPLLVRGEVVGAIASFNRVDAPRTIAPMEFTHAQFDALLEVAAADELDDASFETVCETLLESLVVASESDRIVLLVTEPLDGRAGNLVVEAPAGSLPPGPDHPLGGAKPRDEKMRMGTATGVPQLGQPGVGALVAVPLQVNGRVVGMLSAVAATADHYDRSRVRMVTAAADRLVMAFERRDWVEESGRLTVASETMFSISRIMASQGGFDEKAAALLRLATRTMAGSGAALVGAERTGGPVRWLAGGSDTGELTPEAVAHSIVGRALAQKVTGTSSNVSKDPIALAIDAGARSVNAAPVILSGEVLGVLVVTGRTDRPYPPEQLRLLSAIAENFGVLLNIARLGQQVNVALEREYARLEAVRIAAEQLAIAGSPDQALRNLVEAAKQLVGARHGGVVVWSVAGNMKSLVTSELGEPGTPDQIEAENNVNDVLGLMRFALVQEHKSAVRVNDSPFTDSDSAAAGFKSVLGVPFRCTDGTIGSFFLADKQPSNRFNPEDERLLSLFSAMASVLLDNIRLYNEEERGRQTLNAIHSSMAEGLIVLDVDGQVVFCNGAAEQLLGTGQSEIRGKSLRAWLLRSPERFDQPSHSADFATLIEGSSGSSLEVATSGASHRDLAVSLFPINVSVDESLTGVLLRDVTQEREHERRRDIFVSIASHELRTPMTTVMGFTELLMGGGTSPERQAVWLAHIYEDVERVIGIIDDLLDVSMIQSGNVTFNLRPIDVRQALDEAAEKMQHASVDHSLTVETPEDLPRVLADKNKLTQVLLNLVSNAVKYSPGGGTVAINAFEDSAGSRVVFSVADQGIGIAAKDQPTLFNSFQRIQRAETLSIRGTGLGLYIVKEIVGRMDGEIWLESIEGQGTTFFVALPTASGQVPGGRVQGTPEAA